MRYTDLAVVDYEKQGRDEMADKYRPRLTLRHLHKLRKMRVVRGRERAAHLDLIRKMYGGM